MLDQSRTELAEAPQAERRLAELFARQYLLTELVQDLIPEDTAARTVDQHKKENDETWVRAVYAALKGVQSAKAEGYRIEGAV